MEQHLRALGREVVEIREPGGTPAARAPTATEDSA